MFNFWFIKRLQPCEELTIFIVNIVFIGVLELICVGFYQISIRAMKSKYGLEKDGE